MSSERNIVIVGASISGINTTHYILKHVLPALKAQKDGSKYHVYLISPSPDFYFRIASPRTSASTDRLPAEQILFNLNKHFAKYSKTDFTLLQAYATGLDTASRTIKYSKSDESGDDSLEYHSLVIATGSKTHAEVYSLHTDTPSVLKAIKTMNDKVKKAKDIVIVGGGATGVESAGELGELLNGRPGWFSTPEKKVNITLITAANQLLPALRPAIGKQAEQKLKQLGVDVLYDTRIRDVQELEDGRTSFTATKGEKKVVDLYIPAHGVTPNSSWLPKELLNDRGYLVNNHQTMRVDAAGPRVYALGDIASYSRNTVLDIYDALPALTVNLQRDLLSYDPAFPNRKPKGTDRLFSPQQKEMMVVPVGSAGGVGAIFGWRVPNWFVWLIKSRDFMVRMGSLPLMTGDKVKSAFPLTATEAV